MPQASKIEITAFIYVCIFNKFDFIEQ